MINNVSEEEETRKCIVKDEIHALKYNDIKISLGPDPFNISNSLKKDDNNFEKIINFRESIEKMNRFYGKYEGLVKLG